MGKKLGLVLWGGLVGGILNKYHKEKKNKRKKPQPIIKPEPLPELDKIHRAGVGLYTICQQWDRGNPEQRKKEIIDILDLLVENKCNLVRAFGQILRPDRIPSWHYYCEMPFYRVDKKPEAKHWSFNLLKRNPVFWDRAVWVINEMRKRGIWCIFTIFEGCTQFKYKSGTQDFNPYYHKNNVNNVPHDLDRSDKFINLSHSGLVEIQKTQIKWAVEAFKNYENIIIEIGNELPGQNFHRVMADYARVVGWTKEIMASCPKDHFTDNVDLWCFHNPRGSIQGWIDYAKEKFALSTDGFTLISNERIYQLAKKCLQVEAPFEYWDSNFVQENQGINRTALKMIKKAQEEI